MPDANPTDTPSGVSAPAASAAASAAPPAAPAQAAPPAGGAVDLRWVWLEVRKRVFIKLPFSRPVAETMEAAVPIALDGDTFVCGLSSQKYTLSGHLAGEQVKNTIEAILRQAAGREIRFEVIEGTTLDDWREIKERRNRAQEAVIAMAEQKFELHHVEDVLNQIVGEIRQRVTSTRDRNFPQVRARLLLDVVPLLSDTADMLFPDRNAHEARRALSRTIDRIAGFIDIQPFALALEIERYHLSQNPEAGRSR